MLTVTFKPKFNSQGKLIGWLPTDYRIPKEK